MPEYKPCPFCGSTDLSSEHITDWECKTIRCNNCGALGPPCGTQIEADKAWNERVKILPTRKGDEDDRADEEKYWPKGNYP